ncbi:MAG: alpha/beta fold hydrolase [Elusimicrobiota bacterium]|jgi:pimeloyl-ACP methyl ester carboxylesterase
MRAAAAVLVLLLGLSGAGRLQAAPPAGPAEPAARPAVQAPAPAKRVVRPLPGEDVTLATRDGWTLAGTYLPAQPGKLTVLLLHDGAGRRQDWRPLAVRMQKRGIGYLAWDLRGHGGSQNPPQGQPAQWNKFVVSKSYNEWDAMREDVGAAAAFLKEKGVAPESVLLGGADVGANIALKYAAVHPEVPRIFLVSPSLNYREVLTVNAMRAYKERPILIVASDEDKRFTTEANLLFTFAKASVGDARAGILRVKSKHGTKMLPFHRALADRILDWVEDPVPPAAEVVPSTGTAAGEPSAGPSGDGLPDDAELERRVRAPEPTPAPAKDVEVSE